MTGPADIAEVLDKAADLIEPEGAFTQGVMARTASGEPCGEWRPTAASFSVLGAINRITGRRSQEAFAFFANHLAGPKSAWRSSSVDMATWADAPERTQAEALAALREAADKARGGHHNG